MKDINVQNENEKMMDSLIASDAINEQVANLHKASDELISNRTKLLDSLTGISSDKEFINERLKRIPLNDLIELVKNDEFVKNFFTDDNGNSIDTIDMTDDESINFKRELLIHCKKSQLAFDDIDKDLSELEKIRTEFNQGVQNMLGSIESNDLKSLIQSIEQSSHLEDDIAKKRSTDKMVYFVKSGWTFDAFIDIYSNPNIIKSVQRDFNSDMKRANIVSRYYKKMLRHKASINLVSMFYQEYVRPQQGIKSMEEKLLTEDQYNIPNLMIFAFIRYFAMSDWYNNPNISRLHTCLAMTLGRMISPNEETDPDVKANFIKLAALLNNIQN